MLAKFIRFAMFCFLLLSVNVAAQTITDFNKKSTANKPYFIELYTSQGCSSCPPAETWLSAFSKQTALWDKYFPLAFHVTYWDYIGWKDPYGERAFSQRQYDHLNAKHIGQVYTPQFVINGQEWRGWFDRKLGDVLSKPQVDVGELSVAIQGLQLRANFENQTGNTSPLELHLALVGAGLETKISRGENRNKILQHDFTVLKHQVFIEQANNANHFAADIEPVTLKDWHATRYAWVAWIEQKDRPIQAVGAWLDTQD